MRISEVHRHRAGAALRNLFIADALAMPVHWYYNIKDIFRAFPGGIRQFEAAPASHPSSIMSLHSTAGGGRRSKETDSAGKEVVGNLILKGKQDFWNRKNVHYHHGMGPGENTLNAQCARVLMRCLADHQGRYDTQAFLAAYIDFMTADPPLHDDSYAESYHRGFFANLQRGLPPDRCAAVTHDTPSIGGLVTIAPLVLSQRLRGVELDRVRLDARAHLELTHPHQMLAGICDAYVQLIDRLLFLEDVSGVGSIIAETAETSIGLDLPGLLAEQADDAEVIGGRFSSACYIDGAWPGVLYLLYKYCEMPEQALLANTNLGGDNAHRGAVLGVLLGLVQGRSIEAWYTRLQAHDSVEREIQSLLELPES